MPEVTLEAMIRRISREADREFKHGELVMLWLLDAPDEGIAMLATPLMGDETRVGRPEDKDAFAAGIREFLREHNVTRYARACEVWMPAAAVRYSSELRDDEGRVFVTDVPGSPFQIMGRRDPRTGELCVSRWACVAYEEHRAALDNLECPPPFEIVTGPELNDLINAFEIGPDGQSRPRRVERVMIDGEDSDQYFRAFRDIVRPATGKPYLTPLRKRHGLGGRRAGTWRTVRRPARSGARKGWCVSALLRRVRAVWPFRLWRPSARAPVGPLVLPRASAART